MFAIMCLVFVDVVSRKLFNAPVQGSVEIAELSLPAIVYLGVAYVQARGEHIKLELFPSRVPPAANWLLGLVGTVLALAICVVVTVQIGRSAWVAWQISEHTMGVVDIPVWPAKAAVFLGFLLLSVRLLIQSVETLIGERGAAAPGERVQQIGLE